MKILKGLVLICMFLSFTLASDMVSNLSFSQSPLMANQEQPSVIALQAQKSYNNSTMMGGECESGGIPDKCCSYWTNKVSVDIELVAGVWPVTHLEQSCTTGGENECASGDCD